MERTSTWRRNTRSSKPATRRRLSTRRAKRHTSPNASRRSARRSRSKWETEGVGRPRATLIVGHATCFCLSHSRGGTMRPLGILGWVLIVAGIVVLAIGGFSYVKERDRKSLVQETRVGRGGRRQLAQADLSQPM